MRKRFIAAIIDWSVFIIIALLLTESLKKLVPVDSNFFMNSVRIVLTSFKLFKDLLFRNASLGKRIMGLRIVQKSNGEKASVKSIIIRSAVLIIPLMFYYEFYRLIKRKDRWIDEKLQTDVR